MSVCINSSNLHSGGGVQVAVSFFTELLDVPKEKLPNDISLYMSTEVYSNLTDVIWKLEERFFVVRLDVYGLKALSQKYRRLFKNFDVVFTIFGPDYLLGIKAKRIVGFAQAWIIYSDNLCYQQFNFLKRFSMRARFIAQKYFFKGANAYIVELPHVKSGVVSNNIAEEKDVFIAYNTVSHFYHNHNIDRKGLSIDKSDRPFRIGLISKNYIHKNLSIIPKVKEILENRFKRDVEFFVTLEDYEFISESESFRRSVVNLGPIKVDRCVDRYLQFDAVFFPSLLESFSVSPLEALATGRVLFASDLSFNHDVCGKYAYYFDPLNAEDAAYLINNYIENLWGRDLDIRIEARNHALKFSNPRNRALKYIEIINKVLSECSKVKSS